jgi:hypothetical protein
VTGRGILKIPGTVSKYPGAMGKYPGAVSHTKQKKVQICNLEIHYLNIEKP